jgi:hypothetical protein
MNDEIITCAGSVHTNLAIIKSKSEQIERRSFLFGKVKNTIKTTSSCLDFKFGYHGDDIIETVSLVNIYDGKYFKIPAEIVCFNGTEATGRFITSDTTGCASHTSFQPGLLCAINELVEKNNLVLMWLKKEAIYRLSPSLVRKHSKIFNIPNNLDVSCYDISFIPGFYCILTIIKPHDSEGLFYSIGCGCSISFHDSLSKSIEECLCLMFSFKEPYHLIKNNIGFDPFSKNFIQRNSRENYELDLFFLDKCPVSECYPDYVSFDNDLLSLSLANLKKTTDTLLLYKHIYFDNQVTLRVLSPDLCYSLIPNDGSFKKIEGMELFTTIPDNVFCKIDSIPFP